MIKNFELVKILKDKRLTISFAESITGGLLSKLITDCPGSSEILKESYITYSNEVKSKILNVHSETIDKYGVVSKEVAIEMVHGLKNITDSNINVSVTGNAGPTVCDDKPVGKVYYSILIEDKIFTKELDILNLIKSSHNLSEYDDVKLRELIRDKTAEIIIEDLIILLNDQ